MEIALVVNVSGAFVGEDALGALVGVGEAYVMGIVLVVTVATGAAKAEAADDATIIKAMKKVREGITRFSLLGRISVPSHAPSQISCDFYNT